MSVSVPITGSVEIDTALFPVGPMGPQGIQGIQGEPGMDGSLVVGGFIPYIAGADATAYEKNGAVAVCDGVDDQDELNALIALNGMQAVAWVGNLNVSAPVVVNKTLFHLMSNGPGSLTPQSDFPTDRAVIEAGQTLAYRPWITLSDFRIHGNKGVLTTKSVHGIKFGSFAGRISNVYVLNTAGKGIWLDTLQPAEGGYPPNKNTDFMLSNFFIGYTRDDALVLGPTAHAAADIHINGGVIMHAGKTGNTVVKTGSNGIFAQAPSMQLVDVHIYGNTGCGVYIPTQASRTKIGGSTKIEMNTQGALHAPTGLHEAIITGVGFRGGGETLVRIAGGSGTLTGCTFSGDDPSGPSAEKALNMQGTFVVTGNHFGGGFTTTPKTIIASSVVVGHNSGTL